MTVVSIIDLSVILLNRTTPIVDGSLVGGAPTTERTLRGLQSDFRMKFRLRLLPGPTAVCLMLLAGSCYVNGFPGGAPDDVCATMLPIHHDAVAQTSPAPYRINTSATTYSPGTNVTSMYYILIILYCISNHS